MGREAETEGWRGRPKRAWAWAWAWGGRTFDPIVRVKELGKVDPPAGRWALIGRPRVIMVVVCPVVVSGVASVRGASHLHVRHVLELAELLKDSHLRRLEALAHILVLHV